MSTSIIELLAAAQKEKGKTIHPHGYYTTGSAGEDLIKNVGIPF